MKSEQERFMDAVRKALSSTSDGYCLEIATCETKDGFGFEARIPRRTDNDLGMTWYWDPDPAADRAVSRAEAAQFMREVAAIIEAGQ